MDSTAEINFTTGTFWMSRIIRSTLVPLGFRQRMWITAQTIVDGFLYTNDLAYQTEDGYIYMLGRADDIINVGGEKVSPVEVENTAGLFEQIRECACIGVAESSTSCRKSLLL